MGSQVQDLDCLCYMQLCKEKPHVLYSGVQIKAKVQREVIFNHSVSAVVVSGNGAMLLLHHLGLWSFLF